MELVSKSKVAIIGGGPAGCICAYFLLREGVCPVIFEKNALLKTLLPTGGGRCNLANAEFEMKALAKNYPRGEKFLYSVFSRFATSDTISLFEDIGVKTYQQKDLRIFPISDSSLDVRNHILAAIRGVKTRKEEVSAIKVCNEGFEVRTSDSAYFFDKVIVAIGGHSNFALLEPTGHKIFSPVPALTSLNTMEDFSSLAGVSVGSVNGYCDKFVDSGDILFTHNGISGPLIYKISSVMARKNFPYNIRLDFLADINLQKLLNENSHKSIKNVLAGIVPKALSEYTLRNLDIGEDVKASYINGNMRDKIIHNLKNFEFTVVSAAKGSEVVTCGGVALNEVVSKNMESKLVKNLFFCGEVLDIDGFCGGFNLQNCWSTGFVAAQGVLATL